jgi:branched-subunit amino acid aminotransferase/4-amino-4-deoxychorismate lyase
MVKNGTLITPRLTDSVLESITRDTVIQLAQNELGLNFEERTIDRTELYMADESPSSGNFNLLKSTALNFSNDSLSLQLISQPPS